MGVRHNLHEWDKDFNFTEEYIQKRLDGFFAESTKKYVLENLFVFRWESDKLIETRSGLIYEFEIKVSKSDFKNDFKNKKDKHVILEGTQEFLPCYTEIENKYGDYYKEHYKTSRYKKPNYFYYAVPEGLVEESEIPPYAGLIYVVPDNFVSKDGKYIWSGYYIVKQAPKIHGEKYSDDELKLGERFYYNMLNWKTKYREMKEKLLLSEGTEHKIPYIDLLTKYEKEKKENKAWKKIADQNGETINTQQNTIYDDKKIIRAYRDKIEEYEKDFNPFDFEDKIINKED